MEKKLKTSHFKRLQKLPNETTKPSPQQEQPPTQVHPNHNDNGMTTPENNKKKTPSVPKSPFSSQILDKPPGCVFCCSEECHLDVHCQIVVLSK